MNRLNIVAEESGWLQHGFRSNRSTVDAIFINRMLSNHAHEKGITLFKCFIDLTKAYDKVNRPILWELLRRLGVPDRLVNLIAAIHDGSTASVRYGGELLEPFILNSGLKQGSVFAAFLFNVFLGAIILEITKRLGHVGIQLRYRKNDNIFDVSKMVNKTGFEFIEIWGIYSPMTVLLCLKLRRSYS